MVVIMAANAFFFSNSFSYPGLIDAHRITKTKNASSWGLSKDITEVNATKVGAIRAIFLKPKMIPEQNENYPYMVGDLGLGRMLNDGFVFRQNFHIRSYEVGADKTLTGEAVISLMQETSINHLKAVGVWGGGLGSTPEMCKKNLIWVTAKLQLAVDRYPIWDDVIQIDTWKGAYGKFGLCVNWAFCDAKTSEKLLRASSIWLMMNEDTRTLSKFPNEVRSELDEHLTDTTQAIKADTSKWSTRDESITHHVSNGLMPRWSDLDLNQHVNNAKYITWILESVPHPILKNYELASITLNYSRECRKENVLQSCTYVIGTENGRIPENDHVDCKHVLELEAEGGVIMKGWTTWRSKHGN